MSRVTTALIAAGPKNLSPWGDRSWRVSFFAQLVEGGSSIYWITSPTRPAEHPVVPDNVIVELPGNEFLLESIVMMLSAHLGDSQIEGYLIETENIKVLDGVRHVAPYFDVSAPETFKYLTARLSEFLRLSITVLDEFSLVNRKSCRKSVVTPVFALISRGSSELS